MLDDKENYKKLCRFCLSDTIVQENPLLSLCKCDGSLKYVHLICLQNWLINKLHLKKTDGVLTVLWQGLSCELCKTQLPLSFEVNEQVYDLIDFKTFYEENCPAPLNCLLLQSFNKNGKPSGLHFIDIGVRNQIRIVNIAKNNLLYILKGRGNECEIKLSDISVSRFHSSIKYEKNKFLLKDNSSKFGTLYRNKKHISIGKEHIFIQCGRTLLEIYSAKKWYSSFPCLSISLFI